MPFWITPKKSDSKLKRSNQYLNTLYLTRNGAKAIDKGNIKILKLLIENGSDPNMIEKGDLSPLNRAIFRENFIVIEFLIENGADVNMGRSGLHSKRQSIRETLRLSGNFCKNVQIQIFLLRTPLVL